MPKLLDKTMTISISTSTIFKVLAVIVAAFFLWFIRDIVLLLFVSLLLAALIEPLANWLHKHKVPRALAVVSIYVGLFALFALLLVLLIPPLLQQLSLFVGNFSDTFVALSDQLTKLITYGETHGLPAQLSTAITDWRNNLGSTVGSAFTFSVFKTVGDVIVGVLSILVVLVLAFYMVMEEDAWRRFFRRVAPDEYQPFLIQVSTKMQQKMGLWLRGQLLLMFIVGLCSYIGLLILGVPYALVLGVFAGLMEVVPYAGPNIAAIPAILIATIESPIKGLMVILLYIIIQQTENNILTPKIMQKVAGINPIVTIIAILIGYKLGGIGGAALAVPVATIATVFASEVFGRDKSSV